MYPLVIHLFVYKYLSGLGSLQHFLLVNICYTINAGGTMRPTMSVFPSHQSPPPPSHMHHPPPSNCYLHDHPTNTVQHSIHQPPLSAIHLPSPLPSLHPLSATKVRFGTGPNP